MAVMHLLLTLIEYNTNVYCLIVPRVKVANLYSNEELQSWESEKHFVLCVTCLFQDMDIDTYKDIIIMESITNYIFEII